VYIINLILNVEQNNFPITIGPKTTSHAKTHAKGKSALSDAELIAILIGLGSRNESAVELSKGFEKCTIT
jgi:DNA repair protein RadC